MHGPDNKTGRPPIEVNLDLKAVFDPLCHATAQGLRSELATGNAARLFETNQPAASLEFPNDTTYLALAWDTFKTIDTEELAKLQAVRGWEAQATVAERIQDAYTAAHPGMPLRDNDGVMTPTGLMLEVEVPDHLFGNRHAGIAPLDAQAWKGYEARVAALDPSQQSAVATMQRVRSNNIGKWKWRSPAMRQSSTLLYAHNSHIAPNPLTNNLVVPVGEYGEPFARSLINSTVAMQAFAQTHVSELATEITADNEALLAAYTARAAEAGGATPEATMLTLQEGILSIMQSIAILTAEKVDGYEHEPHQLVSDLVESGLVERLSRYAPMGFVGPMAISGHYFPRCIVRTEDGLAFSDEFEAFLKQQRATYAAEHVLKYAEELEQKSIYDTSSRPIGRICPVAGKDGSIQDLAVTLALLSKTSGTSGGASA